MDTLRKLLDRNGFDWDTGIIVWHDTGELLDDYDDDKSTPGWTYEPVLPEKAQVIHNTHPILDHEYDDGYGGPECPRFVAYDQEYIYFPVKYDGATWADKVHKSFTQYVVPNDDGEILQTPYPGGG